MNERSFRRRGDAAGSRASRGCRPLGVQQDTAYDHLEIEGAALRPAAPARGAPWTGAAIIEQCSRTNTWSSCGECAAYTYLRCILRRVFTPTTGPTKGQRLCPMCAPPAGQVAGDLPDQRQMEASRAPENFLRSL